MPITAVRSTAVYRLDATFGRAPLAALLEQVIPGIKAAGFNAVWIPAVWADFDPSPLALPRTYNQAAFTNARAALDVLRANGMKALVGLDYVGVGWAPNFSPVLSPAQACDWSVNTVTYAAFEQYAAEFLTRLIGYSDVVRPLVFTEGAEGCGQADPAHAVAVAARLRSTLGSLPNRMPLPVRMAFSMGYHDYSMITLGWANGASPIATPNPFDWLSSVAYNVATVGELDARQARWRALYPSTPMILGEVGANGCGAGGEARQAVLNTMAAKYALDHGMGFSVWGWLNHGADECTNASYGGLAITNADGTLRQSAVSLKALIQ